VVLSLVLAVAGFDEAPGESSVAPWRLNSALVTGESYE
jgi:hypothetical protein